MHCGGNRICGRHVIIHFADCEVLENFRTLVRGQGLVNWSSRTRTFLEDYSTVHLCSSALNWSVSLMIAIELFFPTPFPCATLNCLNAHGNERSNRTSVRWKYAPLWKTVSARSPKVFAASGFPIAMTRTWPSMTSSVSF